MQCRLLAPNQLTQVTVIRYSIRRGREQAALQGPELPASGAAFVTLLDQRLPV